MASFDIVVSAENNRYMQWQAMMFHHSCVKVLGRVPIIVVHMDDDPLMEGYELIRKHGGNLQLTPSLRYVDGVEYPPRNTATALQAVETDAQYVVLFDADMVFLRPLPWDDLKLSTDTITFDRVEYLQPEHPNQAKLLRHVCDADGIDPQILQTPVISGGVPHVIPTKWQSDLSRHWLRYIELFPVIDHPTRPELPKYSYPKGPHRHWLATMWSIILAMHHLRLDHHETQWCCVNKHDRENIPDGETNEACLIHYCFDGVGFSKRSFKWDKEISDPEFWSMPAGDDTIDGLLRNEFRETAQYFGLAGN